MRIFNDSFLVGVGRKARKTASATSGRITLTCILGITTFLASCSPSGDFPGKYPPMVSLQPSTAPLQPRSQSSLKKEINIKEDFVASGHYCRWKRTSLTPEYITIHSTQNKSAGAWQHSTALKNGAIRGGKIGYLSWHFTVDQGVAVQHLPLNEIGHHAEYGYGPGNMKSIGIEMCENRGNSPRLTYDKTAKLAAYLMAEYDIPLKNVVCHYNWSGKDCPKPLLDNSRPGYKWAWFISRVDYYYRCINGGASHVE